MSLRHRTIESIALSLGLAGTLGMMFYANHGNFSLASLAFMAWATLPFILIRHVVTSRLRVENNPSISKPAALNAIIIALSTIGIYYLAIFRSQSATTAMVFLCWPVWLAVGTPVMFGLCLKIFRYPSNTTVPTR